MIAAPATRQISKPVTLSKGVCLEQSKSWPKLTKFAPTKHEMQTHEIRISWAGRALGDFAP
jgi:predicted transcriptional regulator